MFRILVFKEDFSAYLGLAFLGYVCDPILNSSFYTVCSDCSLVFSSFDEAFDFSLTLPDEYIYLEQFLEVSHESSCCL